MAFIIRSGAYSGKYILGRCTPKLWWASTGFIFISFLVFRWWNPFRQWPLHPRFVPLRGHQYFQRHPIWESHHSCGKKGNDYNKVRTIHPFIHSLHHYYKTKFDGRQQTFVDFAKILNNVSHNMKWFMKRIQVGHCLIEEAETGGVTRI